LQNAPDATAYIFVYAGRRAVTGQADALGRRAADYLVNSRGVDSRRINIVNGGYREEDFIEIWICPPGATAPQASPTVQAWRRDNRRANAIAQDDLAVVSRSEPPA
jgi:hypothetical protein